MGPSGTKMGGFYELRRAHERAVQDDPLVRATEVANWCTSEPSTPSTAPGSSRREDTPFGQPEAHLLVHALRPTAPRAADATDARGADRPTAARAWRIDTSEYQHFAKCIQDRAGLIDADARDQPSRQVNQLSCMKLISALIAEVWKDERLKQTRLMGQLRRRDVVRRAAPVVEEKIRNGSAIHRMTLGRLGHSHWAMAEAQSARSGEVTR